MNADEHRFECAQCGDCCRNYGYVYLSTRERVLLAEHFGITETEFRKEYCEKRHGEFHLKNPDTDCCFLKGNVCSIYELRPEQCRTWPYWPQNMRDDELKDGICRGRRGQR